MSLLTGPSLDMEKPRIHAVRALANFVVCLRCRIKCYQDPNLYTAKQGNITFLIAWIGINVNKIFEHKIVNIFLPISLSICFGC